MRKSGGLVKKKWADRNLRITQADKNIDKVLDIINDEITNILNSTDNFTPVVLTAQPWIVVSKQYYSITARINTGISFFYGYF